MKVGGLGKTLWIMGKSPGYQQGIFEKRGLKTVFCVYNRVYNLRQNRFQIVLCRRKNRGMFLPDFYENVGKTKDEGDTESVIVEKGENFL